MSEEKDGLIPLIIVPIPSNVCLLHIMFLAFLHPQRGSSYTHNLVNSIILAFSSAHTLLFTDYDYEMESSVC